MKSPCIKLCKIDEASQTCLGCFRTLTEIASWTQMSDQERDSVMKDLDQRRLQLFASCG
ncbi:DUF1289 domain-containing protein [Roseibium sp. RKSG952]|uniref:DUF1289 domain-containing protein n=1 Tax=Roseibium sp. RKSG952 TaxID=2529384 RepID=UPI0012BD345A|nr:DUF1289 domain-containing protein [Roseibium sp. RKSG952]MTH97557.1 DUF1289 domain-containing protein [Roseibium sp. RKSG952]